MKKIKRKLAYCLFLFISSSLSAFAKVEVVTPELTTQYNLDMSTNEYRHRYELAIGSEDLIKEGYAVIAGALYLIDNNTHSAELISKTQSGNPAILGTSKTDPYIHYRTNYFDATDDFSKVVYTSADSNIVANDNNSDQDVFIYDRLNQTTEIISGLKPHEGEIDVVVISPMGNNVAFESGDWLFADTSRITSRYASAGNYLFDSGHLIYIYNVNQKTLTTPKINFDEILKSYEQPSSIGLSRFSDFVDIENLVFSTSVYTGSGYGGDVVWYSFNLPKDETDYVFTTSYQSFHGFVDDNTTFIPLSPTLYAFGSGYSPSSGHFGDQLTVFNYKKKETITTYSQYGRLSKSRRYAILYNYYRSYDTYRPINQPGNIRILNIATGKVRPVLNMATDVRKTFLHRDLRSQDYDYDEVICSYEYIPSKTFYQQAQQSVPCNKNREYYGFKTNTANSFFRESLSYFELAPSDFMFHNDDEFLTFEANQWYLDHSIPYNDFQFKSDIINEYPDYDFLHPKNDRDKVKRTHFVVKNPFLDNDTKPDIRILGKPDIDPQRDSGVYVWQQYSDEYSPKFRVEMVAGDDINIESASSSVPFRGAAKSYQHGIKPLSIEEQFTDRLISEFKNGRTTTRFNLWVKKPYADGFRIINQIDTPLCLMMFEHPGKIYLGPDKIEINSPYDIANLSSCTGRNVISVGEPSIDPKNDKGLFLWQPWPQYWKGVYVSGGGRSQIDVNIESAYNLSNFNTVSFESTDSAVIESRRKMALTMNVSPPWQDGFAFRTLELSGTCISTDSDVPIYIGPARHTLKGSVNLDTLDNCAEYRP